MDRTLLLLGAGTAFTAGMSAYASTTNAQWMTWTMSALCLLHLAGLCAHQWRIRRDGVTEA